MTTFYLVRRGSIIVEEGLPKHYYDGWGNEHIFTRKRDALKEARRQLRAIIAEAKADLKELTELTKSNNFYRVINYCKEE